MEEENVRPENLDFSEIRKSKKFEEDSPFAGLEDMGKQEGSDSHEEDENEYEETVLDLEFEEDPEEIEVELDSEDEDEEAEAPSSPSRILSFEDFFSSED